MCRGGCGVIGTHHVETGQYVGLATGLETGTRQEIQEQRFTEQWRATGATERRCGPLLPVRIISSPLGQAGHQRCRARGGVAPDCSGGYLDPDSEGEANDYTGNAAGHAQAFSSAEDSATAAASAGEAAASPETKD